MKIEAIGLPQKSDELHYGTSFTAETRKLPVDFGCETDWYDAPIGTDDGKAWFAFTEMTWHDMLQAAVNPTYEPRRQLVAIGGPFVTAEEAATVANTKFKEVEKLLGKPKDQDVDLSYLEE